MPRRGKTDPKALKMAKQLIEGLSSEWNPKQYHDTYTEELRRRITAKDKGKEVVETAEEPKARVLDLMAALEASVDAAKRRRTPHKPARKAARKAG
jgi:DNA end-binding protein Ku